MTEYEEFLELCRELGDSKKVSDYDRLKRVFEKIGVEDVEYNFWENSPHSDITIGDDDKYVEFHFYQGKFVITYIEDEE